MSTSSKETYHHGNLHQALIDAAIVQIRNHGADKVSLRGIAREVGVSQSAPYRHFADKAELLTAIANQGYQLLGQAMRHHYDTHRDNPIVALQGAGISYIDFARSHPEMYRLMFGVMARQLKQSSTNSNPKEGYSVLKDIIYAGIEQGQFKDFPVETLAFTTWSVVHGFASLLLDGLIELEEEELANVCDELTLIVIKGIET
jgi:AcrR family transcriptional regulator